MVTGGEEEVVFIGSGVVGGVGGPELLGGPGDGGVGEGDAVVGRGFGGRGEVVGVEGGRGEGDDVVVYHVILVAVVVELDVGFTVVRGVDIDGVVEDMGRGVGGVDVLDEGRGGVF